MKRGASVVLLLVLASAYRFAQEPGDGLNDQQRLGRQIFAQSCGVCHLRPSLNVRTYGPLLSKASTGGDNGRMRNTILEGTTRMPAFKSYLAERSDRRHHCLREDRTAAGGRGDARADGDGTARLERDRHQRPASAFARVCEGVALRRTAEALAEVVSRTVTVRLKADTQDIH